ncbi:MAG TPA: hypothetical protein PK604_04875 [Acetivibrio clariflavus]|nr:hypothetical protein [Acetivibrio clariflavus]HPU41750.1 hypothetical protein [Acetivibrio clariflavus]
MRKKGIGFGIFLILTGLLMFLIQKGILNWSVFTVFVDNIELTVSLILIVVGINLLFKKYPFVKTLTWLAFFSVMIGYGYYTERNVPNNRTVKNVSEKNISVDNQTYVIEHFDTTEKGELNLKASALSLTMGSTESNLIDGTVKDINIKHNIEYKNDKKNVNVKLEADDKKIFVNVFQDLLSKGELFVDRKLILNLNADIVWDLDMKINAVDSVMDFTDLKIKKLDIEGDAGFYKLTLGQEYNETKVKIDADASKVEVFVPVSSGLKVKIDGAANSINFDDLEMEREGKYYISKNYNDAVNKIDLNADIDAGSLKITGIE